LELAEEHGLSGVTVEAISDRAGVAPRTFWAYFSSKEDAVLGRDPERAQALRQALLDRPSYESPLEALQRVLADDVASRMCDLDLALRKGHLLKKEPHLLAAWAAAFQELEQALVEATAQRMRTDPGADMYPGVVVSAACAAVKVAQRRWADLEGTCDIDELVSKAFAQLACGLGAPNRTGEANS